MKTSREAGTGIYKSDPNELVWKFYPLIHKAYYYCDNILIKKIESNSI